MFETELKSIKYDLEFLHELKVAAEKIKTPRIRTLVRTKVRRLEGIIQDIESFINIDIEIEHYPDFSEKEKQELHSKVYEIAHTVENFIVTQENAEIFLVERIENFKGIYESNKKQLIEKEIFEIKILKTFKKVLLEINRILRRHKTEFKEEIEKLRYFRGKIIEMYRDMKILIHKTKKELKEIKEDKLIGAIK